MSEIQERKRSESESSDTYDPEYAPIISLAEVCTVTNEESEEVILKLRAKLYRFDGSDDPPEWKERGTGEVKFLKHGENKTVRLVMRRDKTLKVCANHFITPHMELKNAIGPSSQKSFIYNVIADFSEGQIKSYCLAIRFATPEIATQFKTEFDNAKEYVKTECSLYNGKADEDPEVETSDNESDNEETAEEDNEKTTEEIVKKVEELNVS